MPLTTAQLNQRRAAGRKGFTSAIRRAVAAHPTDLDLAAQHLTGFMRLYLGWRKVRGLTTQHMLSYCVDRGIAHADPRFT